MSKENSIQEHPVWDIGWRIVIYGGFMLLISQFLMWDAKAPVEMKFSENTYTEWTQQVILMIMALLFGITALKNSSWRSLSLILMGISLIGLVREYNNFFNNKVFDGAWQLLALVVLIVVLLLFYPYRKQLVTNLKAYHGTLSEGFLLAGFLATFIFSRLFGRTIFWEAIMEDGYIQSAKNAAEEGVELLGYGLLLIASIEFFLFQRRRNPISN